MLLAHFKCSLLIWAAQAQQQCSSEQCVQPTDEQYFKESVASLQRQLRERGFAIGTAIDHDVRRTLTDGLDFLGEPFYYETVVNRKDRYNNAVYETGYTTPSEELIPHQEGPMTPNAPRYVVLGCVDPGSSGGDAILVDSHQVYASLPSHVQEMLSKRKVRTSFRFDDAPAADLKRSSWRRAFNTTSKDDAHRLARKAVGWDRTWDGKNGSIFVASDNLLVISHPVTGRQTTFQAIAASHQGNVKFQTDETDHARPYFERSFHIWWTPEEETDALGTYYSSEHEFDSEFLRMWIQVEANLRVQIKHKKGQVILLDNQWTMHGRTAFTGDRLLLSAMRGAFRGKANSLQRRPSW